jgi:hypothetical protein
VEKAEGKAIGLLAIWKGWLLLGVLMGVALIASGIYDLRHREKQRAKQQRQPPKEWVERHGSQWVVQAAWVAILGGLMILVVSVVRFFTD